MKHPALSRYLRARSRPSRLHKALRRECLEVGKTTVENWFKGNFAPCTRHVGPLAEVLGVTCEEVLAMIGEDA